MSRHPNHRSSLLTASPPPLSSLLPTDSTHRSIVDACAALKAMVQVPPLPRLSMRCCLHQLRPFKAQNQMFGQHCYYATIITPPTHRTVLDISAGRLSHRHYPRAALCCRVSCPPTPTTLQHHAANALRIFTKHTDLNVSTCLAECSSPHESVRRPLCPLCRHPCCSSPSRFQTVFVFCN